MTQQSGPSMPTSRRTAWELGLLVLLRVTLSVSLLFTAYYLIPTKTAGEGSDAPWLILSCACSGWSLGSRYQLSSRRSTPSSARSRHWRSSFPLYLLIFARIYLSNSLADPSAFTQPLDNTAALYFTVTVFSTVGFGDIVAHTNSMRLLVTLQMLLNLLVLGLVIRLITSAARRGVARRGAQPDLGDRDIPGD